MRRTQQVRTSSEWRECGFIRVFGIVSTVQQRNVHDGHLQVIFALEPQGWHLSISHRTNEMRPRPARYPTWDEIAEARYRFIPDDVTMVMHLPPRDQYVNLHATTFHLHQL